MMAASATSGAAAARSRALDDAEGASTMASHAFHASSQASACARDVARIGGPDIDKAGDYAAGALAAACRAASAAGSCEVEDARRARAEAEACRDKAAALVEAAWKWTRARQGGEAA